MLQFSGLPDADVDVIGGSGFTDGNPLIDVGPDQSREVRVLVTARERLPAKTSVPITFSILPEERRHGRKRRLIISSDPEESACRSISSVTANDRGNAAYRAARMERLDGARLHARLLRRRYSASTCFMAHVARVDFRRRRCRQLLPGRTNVRARRRHGRRHRMTALAGRRQNHARRRRTAASSISSRAMLPARR